jgi:hypothetical protein
MGMLDDAIRQHLELKKRSGATEDEVKRLESEAFGAGRREPAISAPVDPPAVDELPPPPTSPPAAEAPAPPPPPAPGATAMGDWLEDEPEMPTVVQPQPTSEFTAREAQDAQGAPPTDYVAPDEEEGEDLLEETPEFLQETPEHDRLWFEQKPPRDFDFDR